MTDRTMPLILELTAFTFVAILLSMAIFAWAP